MPICKQCLAEKPVEYFYPSKRIKCGHLGKCKECVKRNHRLSYKPVLGENLVRSQSTTKKKIIKQKRVAKVGQDIVDILDEEPKSMTFDEAMHEIKGY